MGRIKLSRRTMLRGVGLLGAGIALPPLEAMLDGRGFFHGAAKAVEPPKKLVVMHWPQGLPVGWGAQDGGFWYPATAGSAWEMTPGLMPLADLRDRINIVSGLTYEQITEHVGSHGHASAVFTGHRVRPETAGSPNPVAQGPSVDQVAAQRIGGTTRFPSIATGLYDVDEVHFTWSASGVRASVELDPRTLFDRVFGTLEATSDEDGDAVRRKRSVLDFVTRDIARLSGILGAADRARLDQHLTAIREHERSLVAPVSAACVRPGAPATVAYADADCDEYAHRMIDLCVMALRCDLTRVVFTSLGPTQNYRTWPHLGVGVDYHAVCHGDIRNTPDGARLADEYYRRIATWHMEQVAYFLRALAADDGTGSLLDTTAFVATSEFSGGGLHHNQFLPVIVAGGIGGMATGQNIVLPCDMAESWQEPRWCGSIPGTNRNRCVNDLWQSALMAVGALDDGEKFGDPALPTQPIAGLWV